MITSDGGGHRHDRRRAHATPSSGGPPRSRRCGPSSRRPARARRASWSCKGTPGSARRSSSSSSSPPRPTSPCCGRPASRGRPTSPTAWSTRSCACAGVSTARLLVSRDRSFPPEEPVGVGGWILDVLKELEQKAPVVVIVDDAHWADIDSLRALLFAARRLVDERVLLVLGQRIEDEQRLPEGLRRLAGGRTGSTVALQPLPPSDVHELATALGVRGFSTRAARRLHAHTGGNALYVKTMLSELPEKRWRTWNPSLPAPRAFTAQVLRRLAAASAPTQASRGGRRGARHHRAGGRGRHAGRGARPLRRAGRGIGRRAAAGARGLRHPGGRVPPSAGAGRGLRAARAAAPDAAALGGGRVRRGRGGAPAAPGAGHHPAERGAGR